MIGDDPLTLQESEESEERRKATSDEIAEAGAILAKVAGLTWRERITLENAAAGEEVSATFLASTLQRNRGLIGGAA